MTINRILIYGILLLCVLVSARLVYRDNSVKTHAKHNSETVIYNVKAFNYNNEGQLTSEFFTPKLEHDNVKNLNYFSNPKMVLYEAKQQPWHITARRGKSIHENTEVILWDNVIIQRAQSEDKPATTVTTTKLTMYPKKGFAITYKPIQMIDTRNNKLVTQVASVGAKFYQKDGKIELLSKARGTYVPE